MKLDSLIADCRKNKLFGSFTGVSEVVTLDKIISAEIPDENTNVEYYKAVEEFMMHGPCGKARSNSPCMVNGRCSKYFPKRFVECSTFDDDVYPVYKRRDNGSIVTKNGIALDNRYVVPHNRHLLFKYKAHINVEWCNQSRSIKYLFKYVNKGHDRVTAEFYKTSNDEENGKLIDEINMYYDYRYISPCEAVWRLFGFDIQLKAPLVERLSFHLPNQQSVVFSDDDPIENIVNRPTIAQSMFLEWFEANKTFPDARELTYVEMPTRFVTVNGVHYASFRDACYARGLVDDDNEYVDAIDEASHWASGDQLRRLFVTLLMSSCIDFVLIDSHKMNFDLWRLKNFYQFMILIKKLGGLFFVYGYGGTGKTFLWRALSPALRSNMEIVLNVASSGIASLLLPGGRTAHSRFAIPISVNEDSTCNISHGSPLAELIVQNKLIIWDEAPMMHKFCFEALDRTMRDLLCFKNPSSYEMTFGGKTVVFGGDFRHILPVIPKGTRQDIVRASISSSYLWKSCKVFRLTKNLRLRSIQSEIEGKEIEDFAKWIATIGDDNVGNSSDDSINQYMNDHNPAEGKTYLSCDSVCKSDSNVDMLADLHTPEFLNGLRCSGVPNHALTLKVGSPVMLLRNIDHTLGLCNGTRLIVTRLADHVLEAKIMRYKCRDQSINS
ncbi:PREDICTED: uncharacterized protein LOC109154409 [Ipomoea nil]|uniref:uncharacterized protein LOC109154409 n=1 Tax=Ipomoea nil TaxID=35883 RepID=UPI000901EFE2|nr:PREDICTED: uncharacterized protein LOC109154409 [Ipomoea nil]